VCKNVCKPHLLVKAVTFELRPCIKGFSGHICDGNLLRNKKFGIKKLTNVILAIEKSAQDI